MSEYFAMGGYAAFIWPAYAVTVIVLGGIVLLSMRRLKRLEAALKNIENAE